jgi:hypothetical protein
MYPAFWFQASMLTVDSVLASTRYLLVSMSSLMANSEIGASSTSANTEPLLIEAALSTISSVSPPNTAWTNTPPR